MVVVITRPMLDPSEQNKMWMGVIRERLIGAAVADSTLPENAAANLQLQDRVARVAQPVELDVPAQLPVASQVSGQVYELNRSIHTSFWETEVHFATGRPLDVTAFSVDFDDSDEAMLHLYYSDGSELQLVVGLDNVWRMNETPYGAWAVRGTWNERMSIFRVNTCSIGNAENHDYLIRFTEDFVSFAWSEPETTSVIESRAQLRQ